MIDAAEDRDVMDKGEESEVEYATVVLKMQQTWTVMLKKDKQIC